MDNQLNNVNESEVNVDEVNQEPEVLNVLEEEDRKVYYNKSNRIHNENGPAIEYKDSQKEEWYLHGLRHRKNGPAITTNEVKEYWFLNKKHREDDLPAVEYSTGDVEYYINNQLHRDNGPAVISSSSQEWFQKGLRHRADGPAVVKSDGSKFYWYKGELISNVKTDEQLKKFIKWEKFNF